MEKSTIQIFTEALGYEFKNGDLLQQALTHKSASKDQHNERLEFLGDAVCDLVVSDLLMFKFMDDEGGLSKKRASLVNETTLARLSSQLDLAKYMILGRGEVLTGGDKKPRLLASVLEALMGAIYLDGGFPAAQQVITHLFTPILSEMNPHDDFSEDYKTRLQEKLQSKHKLAPIYKLKKETGPSHDKEFVIEVEFQEQILGRGHGRSKKMAEQMAAKEALAVLNKPDYKLANKIEMKPDEKPERGEV